MTPPKHRLEHSDEDPHDTMVRVFSVATPWILSLAGLALFCWTIYGTIL